MTSSYSDQINAAAQEATPANPESVAAWLGAGSDALLATLTTFDSDEAREAFVARFASAADDGRRAMLRELAAALAAKPEGDDE